VRELLAKVDSDALKKEVLKIPLVSELRSLKQLTSPKDLAAFLVSYYGGDLLEVSSVRQIVFSLLPLPALNDLCRGLSLPESRYVYDAALVLSTAPWTYSSALPTRIRAELEKRLHKTIPEEFMPAEPLPRPPSIEEIYSEELQPLFAYQQEMSDRVYALLAEGNRRAMLQMPTGSGKTRTVMHAVVRRLSALDRDSLILWMAHSEELCEQAIESFRRSWLEYGEGRARIYRLWGAHKISQDKLSSGIVIASLQKLHSLRVRRDEVYNRLSNSVSAIVFDEAHKALARTYHQLIEDLTGAGTKKVLLGLSATPGRAVLEAIANERLAEVFEHRLIAPTFGGKDPLTALREQGILAHIKRKVIANTNDYGLTQEEGRYLRDFLDFPESLLERVGRDEKRNLLLIGEILGQVRQEKQCIVFACSVNHAKLLAAMVAMRGVSACAITSDMRYSSRVRSIDGFRKKDFDVIVNYGILTTGFDAPNVGAVIIGRPTASIVLYSQMIGRGLRGPKVGGKEQCMVVEVVDNVKGFGADSEVYDYFKDYWN